MEGEENGPVGGFGNVGLGLLLFPSSSPIGVLRTGAVSGRVLLLLPGHTLPGFPDIFLFPLVGEIIYLTVWDGYDGAIVGSGCRGVDRDA